MTDLDFAEVVAAEFADFDDDRLRELIERVAQISEMTQHPGWSLYRDLVVAQTATKQRSILAGHLTPDVYSRECGWVAGAIAALDAPARQANKLELRLEQLREQSSPNKGVNDNGC